MAWCWHHFVWITSAVVLLLAVGVLALRYWVLPNVDQYRASVEQSVSKAAAQRVTIGRMSADWNGLRPRLNLGDVVVYDKAGRSALTLKRVDSTVSWLSLVLWRPRFSSLELHEPSLDIRRDKNGVISVGGIEMAGDSQGGGFSDWVLSQRAIEIHNAAIDWTDEHRGAPTLQLRKVELRMQNRGERHRFGLTALPPAHLAGPLDVRGDLTGKSLKNIADWRGRFYAQLESDDIAAWRTWVPFPVEFSRGSGALRAWAVIRDRVPQEITADVRLTDVRTRLHKDLPELALNALSGRVAWKMTPNSQTFSTTQLGLTTAGKLTLQPTDFTLRTTTDAKGASLSGEIKFNAINVAPLVSLAEHVPLDAELRKRLAELALEGRMSDASVRWDGVLPSPMKYSAHARFEDLSVNAYGALPGIKGASGTIDASEKGGTLQIESRAVNLDMPALFKVPLDFDTVSAQTSWTRDPKGKQGIHLKVSKLAFANADLAGTLTGTYQGVPEQPGIADFTGNLSRADARRIMPYMPLPVARSARGWMEAAFLAGTSNDVNFRVKGDLREFPFEGDKTGTFFVTFKVAGGEVHYGDGWPDLQQLEGDVAFRGRRMEILARQGVMSGVRLSGVRADIADLAQTRLLVISGEAEGTTPEFLKFIATSPVTRYIDRFTEGIQGEGQGKLRLRMELPLRDMNGTRLAGSYQMTANRLLLDPSIPPLEQVDGRLEFTESGVNVPAATATFFGGPLSIAGSTQRDGSIQINLKGRVNPDVARRAGGAAWVSSISGAADWTGSVAVRKKTVDLVLESTLQGLALNLPAPLAKAAADTLPVRLERRFVSSEREQLVLSMGDIVSARLIRRSDGNRIIIDRAMVRLGGGAAAEPERDGVFVSGSIKSINIDAWLKLMAAASVGSAGAGGGAGAMVYTVNGLDLKLGEFELYDRKFGELAIISQTVTPQTTRYRMIGREIEGIADWTPQGRGRLVALLQKLTIPLSSTTVAPVAGNDKKVLEEAVQLPALDVTVDQFQMGTKPLGKLELAATQQERDWRIDKLTLTHADGTLKADGVWQSWLTNPRTQVNVQWSILDAGSTLGRLGYPNTVRGGIAQIGGTLSWHGGPYRIDYPTLSGKFAFRAEKGQFRQMEPGFGKLLGIISLQSLPRRLSLDFRDIFSKGFAFDEILGEIQVDRGIAATDKFLIAGPAAKVLMSGNVDLGRETQNLQMKVSPHLSEGVAIATGLLGGPIAALAAYVAQKLLKDPFDNLVSFRYAVTGSWVDPVVARVDAPVPQAASTE